MRAAATLGLLAMAALASADGPRVAEGIWGGTGLAVDVNASGARVELDCAHGTIDAPLSLDGEGRFDLPGTFVQERPGPVRMDEEEKSEAVRWLGRLDGDTLTVRAERPNAPRPMHPLSAVRGRNPVLRKCG